MDAEGDQFEGQSEVGSSDGTQSSTKKRRRCNLEKNSDEKLKDNMREDLIVRQKLEVEKVELKREKRVL